jgi:hypothetical protein
MEKETNKVIFPAQHSDSELRFNFIQQILNRCQHMLASILKYNIRPLGQ